jgi:hypothetical protein
VKSSLPIRSAALICVLITTCAAVYAAGVAITGWNPSFGYIAQATIHLGELAGVIALALSGAAGRGWLARIGLGAAILGQLLLSAAELIYPANENVGDQLFNIAPPLSAIGLVLTGIAVLRTATWKGWHRFTPLILGLYVFVVMTPTLIAAGGPPAAAAVWAIAGWEICWVLLGASSIINTPVASSAITRTASRR